MSPAALDLAEQLLTFDPERRATAVQALEAPYFREEQPPPSLPVGYVLSKLGVIDLNSLAIRLSTLEGEWHEFESKRERARKRRKVEGQQSSA